MNCNKCLFIGRLARDPVYYKNEDPQKNKCLATLMVNRSFNRNSKADAIPLEAWGKKADAMANYCEQGMELHVEAAFRTNRVGDVTYTGFEVLHMSFGRKKQQAAPSQEAPPMEEPPVDYPEEPLDQPTTPPQEEATAEMAQLSQPVIDNLAEKTAEALLRQAGGDINKILGAPQGQ